VNTSWRTTFGGSVENLGSSLRDVTLLTSLAQVASGDELHKLNLYITVAGIILCQAGKFFSNLWAADNASVVKALAEHANDIAQLKGDTSQLAKEVHDK